MIFAVIATVAVFHPTLGHRIDPAHLSVGQITAWQLIVEAPLVPYLLWAIPWAARRSLSELGFRIPQARDLGIALLAGLGMFLAVDVSGTLIELLAHSKHEEQAVALFQQAHSQQEQIVFVLFGVVLAPVAEELIFRVFVFNAAMRSGSFAWAATVSSVLFGLSHADLLFFVPLALGGVILCTAYYRSRNAWTSMIAHALFNAGGFLALYAQMRHP